MAKRGSIRFWVICIYAAYVRVCLCEPLLVWETACALQVYWLRQRIGVGYNKGQTVLYSLRRIFLAVILKRDSIHTNWSNYTIMKIYTKKYEKKIQFSEIKFSLWLYSVNVIFCLLSPRYIFFGLLLPYILLLRNNAIALVQTSI